MRAALAGTRAPQAEVINLVMVIGMAAVVLGLAALLTFLEVRDRKRANQSVETEPVAAPRHRIESDPDSTILGPRPENDAIFGTWPNLRVPDRLTPAAGIEEAPDA
jgi:hypothetical protein